MRLKGIAIFVSVLLFPGHMQVHTYAGRHAEHHLSGYARDQEKSRQGNTRQQEYRWIFKYDDKGNTIEEVRYRPDGRLENRWVYRYDTNDNRIEAISYDHRGRLVSKWIHKYDENDKKTETIWYDSRKRLEGRKTYNYDLDNKVEINWYDQRGRLESMWVYEYDSIGSLIRMSRYNASGSLDFDKLFK
jgi:hypothetical protein